MQATISVKQPQSILGNTRTSIEDFFLVHVPHLEGCVCTRFDFSAFQPAAFQESKMAVVVIACTLEASRSIRRGSMYFLERETPITFVEQVGSCAFRECVDPPKAAKPNLNCRYELKPFFGGKSILVPTRVNFSADINAEGRALDCERVLRGFHRLIDDCLKDVIAKCAGCGAPLANFENCPYCETPTSVRASDSPAGAEVPPLKS